MTKKILQSDDLESRVGLVVGTRPGIIKFSPVIRELTRRDVDFVMIHTGQHYSPNMDRDFFSVLGLRDPDYTNEQTSTHTLHGAQTASMIVGVEEALFDSRPATFIVCGDANTNFAAAVAVRKLVSIELAHMEAGLRSFDWRMPEEHNRVMIDHISDVIFTPTEDTAANLRRESVRGEILVCGNTIVDAVRENLELARERSEILASLGVEAGEYSVATVHREENVDSPEVMRKLFALLDRVGQELAHTVVFPIHPRTRKRVEEFGLTSAIGAVKNLRIIDPVDYLDMLRLLDGAAYVLTDSGGIQEECCVLRRPCITLRESTERPETVVVGANRVVGASIQKVESALQYFRTLGEFSWDVPYGDGFAARRIVDRLAESLR